MRLRLLAKLYALIIGIAMIGMWLTLILTNQVPELTTEPIRLSYHLIAEFLTAILLLISGIGLITKHPWAPQLFLLSLGMLLYTVIVSAGYYLQTNDIAMTGLFTLLQILTILFIGLSLFKPHQFTE